MNAVLRATGLTKRFGEVTAVDDLSFDVGPGEIYAFLGLNGAGKTTTIRMLLGLIQPTSGTTEILGSTIRPGTILPWSSVGYLVEVPSAYPELTVRENLEVMRRLRSYGDAGAVDRIIKRLELGEYADRRARTLSLGNAQRLGLAKALLHSPQILILDEPANGLDPAGIVEVRELLLDLAQNHGATIFISSHILGEVSKLATRVGIIHEGRLIIERTADELERDRRSRLLVDARDQETAAAALRSAGIESVLTEEGTLEVKDERALKTPEDIARILVHAQHPPTLLKVEREDLESYFLRLVGKESNHE